MKQLLTFQSPWIMSMEGNADQPQDLIMLQQENSQFWRTYDISPQNSQGDTDQIEYLALNFNNNKKNHLYQILSCQSSFPEVWPLPMLAKTFSRKGYVGKGGLMKSRNIYWLSKIIYHALELNNLGHICIYLPPLESLCFSSFFQDKLKSLVTTIK